MEPNKNILQGYIKFYRSVVGKAWYKKDSEFVHLWLHLLLQAAHSEYETWLNGSARVLRPGQLVTGRKKLASETGINESKIERVLKSFENEHQIEQLKTSSSRLITIINWNEYQKNEQPNGQRVNNERTTTEQRVNTIQEGKEYKKERVRSPHTQIFLDKINANTFSEDEVRYFENLTAWITVNAPEVGQMPEPLNIKQAIQLKNKWPGQAGEELIRREIMAIAEKKNYYEKRIHIDQ